MMADKVSSDFTAYYLHRATKEFAEDLDRVRDSHDFQPNSVSHLVHALQQGMALFSVDERRRVIGYDGNESEKKEALTSIDSE
jgi:ribosome assembly protein 3